MLKSLSTAATGMDAQQTNMDVIANNIANVSTEGFKKSKAQFEDLMYQTLKEPGSRTGENAISPNGVQVGLGVNTVGVQKDFSVGSPKLTRNPLDLQIDGKGFFTVKLPDGRLAYSRDGSFKKNANGLIVNKNGYSLVPQVTLPPGTTSVNISSDGQIGVVNGVDGALANVGQVEISDFVNPGGLRAMGQNLFLATEASGTPSSGRPGTQGFGFVQQGRLEMSNVNIVDEMVNMISAQRAYETNSKVVQAADQMLQQINSIR